MKTKTFLALFVCLPGAIARELGLR
jgi:hypothetical protein